MAGNASTIDLLGRSLVDSAGRRTSFYNRASVFFASTPLVPEAVSFLLLVGLISAIRRVLVLTAEFGEMREKDDRHDGNTSPSNLPFSPR